MRAALHSKQMKVGTLDLFLFVIFVVLFTL